MAKIEIKTTPIRNLSDKGKKELMEQLINTCEDFDRIGLSCDVLLKY